MSVTLPVTLLLTCEHGGNQIPQAYESLFAGAEEVLQTHRGYDPGALELARRLAEHFEAPLFLSTTSRLLIELNRTIGNKQLFSTFSRQLSHEQRDVLINDFYLPFRTEVVEAVKQSTGPGRLLHVSVHSFTPVMKGKTRPTEIGLLYDPLRPWEKQVCELWKSALRRRAPDLKTHYNLPYRGTSDGFVVALRKEFPDDRYAGIEIEINQKFPLGDPDRWQRIQTLVQESLSDVMQLF